MMNGLKFKTRETATMSPCYTRHHRCTQDVTIVHTTSPLYTRRHRYSHDVTVVHTTSPLYTRRHRYTHDVIVVHTTSPLYTRRHRENFNFRNVNVNCKNVKVRGLRLTLNLCQNVLQIYLQGDIHSLI